MAVYCVPRDDEDLFADIGDAKSILLAGCPSCANIGYYMHREKDRPIIKFTLKGIKSVCTKDEIDRISHLLMQKGVHVVSWLPNYPNALCVLDKGARKRLLNKGQDVDTILAMCCESGQENVANIFPDKELVGAMNAKGLLRGVTRKKLGKFFVDEQTIEILKFTPEQ
jgi:hypothetical protein